MVLDVGVLICKQGILVHIKVIRYDVHQTLLYIIINLLKNKKTILE